MSAFATYPSLEGRSVFITGGAQGIGESIVQNFARQGSKVAFVDIDDKGGEALAESLAAEGLAKPLYRHCDVRDIAALRAVIAEAAREAGPFTILVNNAAHDQRHAAETVEPDYWDERFAVNLRHQFFAAQAIMPMMQAAGGGSIVNYGSTSWRLKQGGMPAYTAAKAGVEGLTRGLARDWGPHGIRVNSIMPGWVMTKRQLELWVTPEGIAQLELGQVLPGRVMPADLARMTLFLAADDSAMISGQSFLVDGGWANGI
jgi:NAD(P)-dependent dehydrogenase (short-subunit alcohol dehydrogenase family)